ncbi:aldehyde dehydrogenase family protein [Microbulbifer sp. SH-1]|uniref:aldehyde dehydrogenase family protein n=1 Tax=Microbulbifer sp. SH-1 TaxID=2681547 RepID=UPI00197BA8B1|nr:aldehyde dehydrogenase family protein [Microbulbifer sp. SH-1]
MQVAEIFTTMSYGPSPESTANVDTWLENRRDGFGLFINGAWSASAKSLDSVNPINGKPLAKIAFADGADVDTAVKAARAAQPAWESLGGHGRARYLHALAQLLRKRMREFAVLESLDSGKPIGESSNVDIPLAIHHIHQHTGWAQLCEAEFPERRARGVAGLIISSAYPLLMAAQTIAPALAAGNSIVLKPSEKSSLSALMFAELCEEIGLPPGVVNIVTGDGSTGEYLTDHPDVDQLTVAGSAAVGRKIRYRTAGSGKTLALDLAGQLAFIIFDDADLDSAVEALVDAVCSNQGRPGAERVQLLVQESVETRLLEKLRTRVGKLRVGDPLDHNTDLADSVDSAWFERVAGTADDSIHEELFRPLLSVVSFRLQSEAMEQANSGSCHQTASVWSENIDRAVDLATGLKAATVGINCHTFSVFGGEGVRDQLEKYLRPRREFSSGDAAAEEMPAAGAAEGAFTEDLLPIVRVGDSGQADIQGAVSAAARAASGVPRSGIRRAQVLYRLAENLSERADEFCWRLARATGVAEQAAKREVDASLVRLFTYAAWADNYDGAARQSVQRGIALALNQAIGVIGIGCPDHQPLLAPISLVAPALAMGNRVVLVPSEGNALAAPDYRRLLEQILAPSCIPDGVVNIVTGARDEILRTLAAHKQVNGIWYFGSAVGSQQIERAAAEALTHTWVNGGKFPDWFSRDEGEGRHFLREASRVKNIWIPGDE